MPGLPWFRMDSNVATHDKLLSLIHDGEASKGDRYQAAWSYVCSLGHAAGQGTDGLIKFDALHYIHGTRRTAALLVKHFLWAPDPQGWSIPTWDDRQQSSARSQAIKNAQSAAASRTNCIRWHAKDCKCWEAA